MQFFTALLLTASAATGHYTLPIVQGTPEWSAVRKAKNWQDNGFVSDVTSSDIRCNQLDVANETVTVAAGQTVSATFNNNLYHPGPFQSYMAKVPEGQDITTWDPTDAVWFRIYADQADLSGSTITWPSDGKTTVDVTIPACLPAGEYLMRSEQIALHVASTTGGAQFYLSCAQLSVTGGGGTAPQDLVAFPGAYKAADPGILININYPKPTSYTNPGPTTFTC